MKGRIGSLAGVWATVFMDDGRVYMGTLVVDDVGIVRVEPSGPIPPPPTPIEADQEKS